jgi:hypothetical protein
MGKKGCKGSNTHNKPKDAYFNKSLAQVGFLVNKIWFSHYPCCQVIIYDNGREFKLNFETLCDSYGIKCKPGSIKNLQANAILERMHQVIMTMLHTTELDMANTVVPSDIADFLTDTTWAICSTYHTVLKASPGAAIFGRDMLFDIPFLADRNKIGDHRQCQTDRNTACKNKSCIDWVYKIGDKVLLCKEGIFNKSEIKYHCDPWTISTVHTNGTIRVHHRTKSE